MVSAAASRIRRKDCPQLGAKVEFEDMMSEKLLRYEMSH